MKVSVDDSVIEPARWRLNDDKASQTLPALLLMSLSGQL
jgi:hypothetical protein